MKQDSLMHAASTKLQANSTYADRGKPRRGITMAMLVGIWLAIVAIGIVSLWEYEHQNGARREGPESWPHATAFHLATDRPTLLFFAHPKCPCTRASIEELARIMTACNGQLTAYAIFVKPQGCAQTRDWEKTDLWRSAEQIPGVQVHCDFQASESIRFGAVTSGLALLYSPDGDLLFQGGITSSRGHSGDNLGRSTIVHLVQQGAAEVGSTRVYGCELITNHPFRATESAR